MSTWPATLPQHALRAGFKMVRRDNVIKSPMGYGPAKKRLRSHIAIHDVTVPLIMTDAQRETLETFYDSNAALEFDWIDHSRVSSPTVTYTFAAPPRETPIGRGMWAIILDLEMG